MPKPNLKAVPPATEPDDDPGALREIELPAVPSQPVLDELAVYRAGQQSELDRVNAERHALANEIVARTSYFVRERERLEEEERATMAALHEREARLSIKQDGIEAALAATQPREG